MKGINVTEPTPRIREQIGKVFLYFGLSMMTGTFAFGIGLYIVGLIIGGLSIIAILFVVLTMGFVLGFVVALIGFILERLPGGRSEGALWVFKLSPYFPE
jgi:hypothetical protein